MSEQSELARNQTASIIRTKIGEPILRQLQKGQVPELEILSRSMENVDFDENAKLLKLGSKKTTRRMSKLSEIRPFMQTVLIANSIIEAKREGQVVTLRDVYYANVSPMTGSSQKTLKSQEESNVIIQDLEVMTGLLREQMGIIADAKGSLVGPLTIKSRGDVIPCSKQGDGAWSIPSMVDDVEFLDTSAKFVLVIEKGTAFQRLNYGRWWKKHNAIMVEGGGQPDRGTRRMVKRLNEELGLPVFVCCDADPYGWHIYSVYRFGSMSLAYTFEMLACPKARFIGISASDIYKYRIPKEGLLKAEKADLKRAEDMLKYPWFKDEFWQKELKLFLRRQQKSEIEALSRHSYKFLAETYLPDKLREHGVL